MDIATMHIAFNTQLQRIASHVFDDLLPEEIDLYLNNATIKFVETNKDVIISSPDSPDSRKATEDIRVLVETQLYDISASPFQLVALSEFDNQAYSGDLGELDPKFAWFLYARSSINGSDVWKNNRLVSPTEWNNYTTTTTNEPVYRDLPLRIEGDFFQVHLSSEDTALDSVRLTYLTFPDTVLLDHAGGGAGNVDSNLPEQTHQRIVDLAVQLAITDLQKGASQENN